MDHDHSETTGHGAGVRGHVPVRTGSVLVEGDQTHFSSNRSGVCEGGLFPLGRSHVGVGWGVYFFHKVTEFLSIGDFLIDKRIKAGKL